MKCDCPGQTWLRQGFKEVGQRLALIAKDYNVSIDDIDSLNNISNPDFIYPGEQLLIPAASVYVAPPPPAPTSVGRSILVSTEGVPLLRHCLR